MATLAELRERTTELLMLEGAAEQPNAKRLLGALNLAKNDVVGLMETLNPWAFIERVDRTVAAGDAYVSLPPQDATEAPLRRLMGVHVVNSDGSETAVEVLELRDPAQRYYEAGFWMYPEGRRLYFSGETGADLAMTLRLRYAAEVSNLDGTDLAAEYDYLTGDWLDVVVMQAVADLLPAANPGRAKWIGRRNERVALLTPTYGRRNSSQPLRVRQAGSEKPAWVEARRLL